MQNAADELWARAKANGYEKGAHTEVDKVRDAEKCVSKTKRDQNRTLRRYILYVTLPSHRLFSALETDRNISVAP